MMRKYWNLVVQLRMLQIKYDAARKRIEELENQSA